MLKPVAIVFMAFLPAFVSAQPELKGSPDELRNFLYPSEKTVMLFAHAEEKAYTDTAIISLVITTDEKQLSQSIAANQQLRTEIIKKLVASGIDAKAINNSKFSSSPEYGWFGKKPSSYKVINRVSVSITDENQLKTIAAIADGSENIELAGTEFEHSKKSEFKEKVKTKALEDIKRQKSVYEKSLDLTLTPIGIRDAAIRHTPTRGAMQLEEVMVTAQRSSKIRSNDENFQPQPESSFDEILYQADISVEFSIATKP